MEQRQCNITQELINAIHQELIIGSTNRFSGSYLDIQSPSFQVQPDAKRRAVRRNQRLCISLYRAENRLVSAYSLTLHLLLASMSTKVIQLRYGLKRLIVECCATSWKRICFKQSNIVMRTYFVFWCLFSCVDVKSFGMFWSLPSLSRNMQAVL